MSRRAGDLSGVSAYLKRRAAAFFWASIRNSLFYLSTALLPHTKHEIRGHPLLSASRRCLCISRVSSRGLRLRVPKRVPWPMHPEH